jgi:hypothetical protein
LFQWKVCRHFLQNENWRKMKVCGHFSPNESLPTVSSEWKFWIHFSQICVFIFINGDLEKCFSPIWTRSPVSVIDRRQNHNTKYRSTSPHWFCRRAKHLRLDFFSKEIWRYGYLKISSYSRDIIWQVGWLGGNPPDTQTPYPRVNKCS